VVQHPYDESDYFKGPDNTVKTMTNGVIGGLSVAKSNAMRAQVGYLGPFPVVKR
jgi:hypothetical protein